jgi:hypothetical protein
MGDVVQACQEVGLDLAAIVFLVSGAAKAAQVRSFREGLLYLPYMPISGTYLVAWTLPAMEVAVAIGLILNVLAAKVAALVLLAFFCGAVVVVLRKRLKVPCGCFEGLGERYLSAATLRDNGLIALAIIAGIPLEAHGHVLQSAPVAAFVLVFYLIVHELWSQRRLLAALRQQGAS